MNKKTTLFLTRNFWNIPNIFLTILLGCLFGCSNDDSSTKCSEKKLDANCCPQIDSSLNTSHKPDISVINVFLETSGSMKGFMPSDTTTTEFQTIIPEILSNLNTEYSQRVRFYSIHSSDASFNNLDLSSAKKNIQKGGFEWTGSTYLPVMLDSIFKGYLKHGAVNIFISDCIYSPETKDAKDVNLTQTDIRDKMKPYSHNFSTTSFCLLSDFRSKNIPLPIKSPYYLILQGEPTELHAVENLVLTPFNTYSQNYHEINFGLYYPQSFYTVLPYTETSGNFIPLSCDAFENAYVSIQEISSVSQKDSVQFWVGLNLQPLPNYAKEIEYLDSNLKLNIVNGSAKIITISNKRPSSIASDDIKVADKCTHFVQVKITKLEDPVSTLDISIKYSRPQWISSLDEPQNANNRSKTFKLEKWISGFELAYNQDNSGYFLKNTPIALIKK